MFFKKKAKLLLALWILLNTTYAYGTTSFTARNKDEFNQAMIYALNQRIESFKIYVTFAYVSQITDLLNEALLFVKCKDPYTFFNLSGYTANFKYYPNQPGILLTLTFEYLTTKEQEAYVEEKTDLILSNIIKDWMTPYDKIAAIHDWVVKNISYDETLTMYTAYDALSKGKAVCQGYSLLIQKLLQKAGLESIIAEGYSRDLPHSWNMVKLCTNEACQWFHLDATWDDPVEDYPGRILRMYFLLSDHQIEKDHEIDDTCGIKATETLEEFICETSSCLPEISIKSSLQADFFISYTEFPIALTMQTSSNTPGDYFLWCDTPVGTFWFTLNGWVKSDSPIAAYTGEALNFDNLVLFYLNPQTLPKGAYNFFFAFDEIPNGRLDFPRSEACQSVGTP